MADKSHLPPPFRSEQKVRRSPPPSVRGRLLAASSTQQQGESTVRTESLGGLLETIAPIADAPHLQHLHCYVYYPYRHWQTPVDIDEESTSMTFSADFLPIYEGWRACWVRPERDGLVEEPGLQEAVLRIHLCFHDGVVTRALLTKRGQLVVKCRKSAPDRGLLPDVNNSEMHYTILDVARELTLSELLSGRRGNVLHLGALALDFDRSKYSRRVMNIVSCTHNECVVRKIPADLSASDCETVRLPRDDIERYDPQMLAEYQTRVHKSMTKAEFEIIRPYLTAWIKKAMIADLTAHEAVGPATVLSTPNDGYIDLKKALARIVSVMEKKKRGI